MTVDYKAIAKDYADKYMEDLFTYLRYETGSAQGREIPETANFVRDTIIEAGGESEILGDLGGHPVVYGYFKAGANGNSDKTLLFYNHYDVQPEDPIDEWKTNPFEPTVVDGKIVARGVSDNKANFMSRIVAVKAIQDTEGGLPCNVKFFVEGEEEIGSPNIDKYLETYADKFSADACIWESGSKDSEERMVISAGVKGIAYFEASVVSADIDIHSSQAAVIDNGAWRLVHALATLRDADNNITVDGFKEMRTEPTDVEKASVAAFPYNEAATIDTYGLKQPLITDGLDYSAQEALILYPTMTISGLLSGYTGQGTKTVLPRKAMAKIDVRLVPGYEPKTVYDVLRKHFDNHGFKDVDLKLLTGVKPFRTDISDPFTEQVINSAKEVYGEENVILELNSAGTGPMYGFGKYLNVPILGAGTGWVESGAHAPNENIRIADYYQGVEHIIQLLHTFGGE